VKEEFHKLCHDFHSGNLDIQSINSAFITLIPKKDSLEVVNDYRPISLVSMALKFLTKILANRMQKIIIPAIHRNQYGFIKNRTIHDCLAWAFEYIHLCHQSKKEIVILKLDFEKAFDKVEYSAILLMLKHLGFGNI
jgi:retron-type reverse transcriptase